jgi:histone deacetylase 11
MKITYSPNYNITFFGIERTHPFDSRKYGRAWTELEQDFSAALTKYHVKVERPISEKELLLAHSPTYLASLRSSGTIARALEMPFLSPLPAALARWRILRPMRWAVQGSIVAARCALQSGLAVNLSGGYHHAKPDQGEGFCLFSDAAMIVRQLKAEGQLQKGDEVLYIDLDAHQGNGICHQFLNDPLVHIFDQYNSEIYPKEDSIALKRIDCNVPLKFNCSGAEYLRLLQARLPEFVHAFSAKNRACRLAIYNAGTDPFAGDTLGGLCLSALDILERDLFVFEQLRAARIPAVMLLSGGYSKESYRLVAATVRRLLQLFGQVD